MTIRPAVDADTPAIVELLKAGLGESLMPKSAAYWRWKHLDNPFGPSAVLLAFEQEQLIGVRAFMQWSWRFRNEIHKSVRAVDTVTHPGFRGKGIFRKLTLDLASNLMNSETRFVFNTPNKFSRPGYLGMGWELAGKLPIRFTIRRPFRILTHLLGSQSSTIEYGDDTMKESLKRELELNKLVEEHNSRYFEVLKTDLSLGYLRWRYLDNPAADYMAIEGNGGLMKGLAIARVKITKAGREMRITDVLQNTDSDSQILWRPVMKRARVLDVDYIAASALQQGAVRGVTIGLGPSVTVRNLDNYQYFYGLKGFRNWSPSLGDLELF